jgi:hypothetical protein
MVDAHAESLVQRASGRSSPLQGQGFARSCDIRETCRREPVSSRGRGRAFQSPLPPPVVQRRQARAPALDIDNDRGGYAESRTRAPSTLATSPSSSGTSGDQRPELARASPLLPAAPRAHPCSSCRHAGCRRGDGSELGRRPTKAVPSSSMRVRRPHWDSHAPIGVRSA